MPIDASEIKLFRSASTGSMGGARTTTVAGQSLFDAVSAAEAAAGRVEYRCVYVANGDTALALTGAQLSVQSDSTSASTSVEVGVGTSAVNGTEQPVGAETSAPAGVTFGASASLGDIPANGARAAWIRRTVTAGAAALPTDATILRVTGSYSEGGTEPETFFDSLTYTDGADVPWAAQNGRPLVFSVHGSSGANSSNGRQWRAQVSGKMAYQNITEFGFSLVPGFRMVNGTAVYHVLLRPIDNWPIGGSPLRESMHIGFKKLSDNRVYLVSEHRYDTLLRWMLANLTQYDLDKRVIAGGSMGGWGSVSYGIRRPDQFAAIYPDRPRWRYSNTSGMVAVATLENGLVNTNVADAPLLSAEDGGGSYADYVDMIAYISNASNKVRPILWCCGRQDGFALFSEQIAAVNALRATKRAFAFAWNDGDHATGSIMSQLVDSYPYGTYSLSKGYPLFTEHSGDQDPNVDLVGGINIGLTFRNVVESASGWSCEVSSTLGARTVKVEPISDVFTKSVAAKTVTIPAANSWAAVSFS